MISDAQKLSDFLAAYADYVADVLRPTQLEIRAQLAPWQKPDYWSKYRQTNRMPIPLPVRTIISRIKRPEQVVDKIFRKREQFPRSLSAESMLAMRDALGVRVLVFLNSHLLLIDRELRNVGWLEISTSEPAVAYVGADQTPLRGMGQLETVEKESGYTSIHYTLRLRNSAIAPAERPWFELQVRTLGQEWWSAMEHHLGYKPSKRTHMGARRQFRILSRMIGAIDENFNLLYEELSRYQEETTYEAEDVLGPENLPAVLAELGISCAQRDISNIIKFLTSRDVHTVTDLRSLATPNRLATIQNTYLTAEGRAPVNLETIAALAALKGISAREDAVRNAVMAQIAYRGAWDDIRQEFTEG